MSRERAVSRGAAGPGRPSRWRWLAWPLLAVLAGVGLSVLVARWTGLAGADLAGSAVQGVGVTLGVLAAGYGAERLLRSRRARVGNLAALAGAVTAVAALSGLGAVAVGMMAAHHEIVRILVLLPVTAGVGVAFGLLSARHTARDLEHLAGVATRVGGGDLGARAAVRGPGEVAEVAAALNAAAERLREAFERERAEDAHRRDLVAWVSHDLRTPLASLRAAVEALADGVVDDEVGRKRYLDSLLVQVDRLTALVDDLFELAQIETGALRLEPEPTWLPGLVSEVLRALEPDAEAAGVRLVADLPERSEPVMAGRDQLARVLANLVANGVRHTPPEGRVVVRLRQRDGDATIAVADACGGLEAADLPRVFERLWRGDAARAGGGTGLGLAIARALVEAHGGTIAAANVPGGCQFTVDLPAGGAGGAGAPPG